MQIPNGAGTDAVPGRARSSTDRPDGLSLDWPGRLGRARAGGSRAAGLIAPVPWGVSLPLDAAGSSPFDALRASALGCTRCDLSLTRTQVVFGVGDPGAALMFVGEGPGWADGPWPSV